MTTPARSENFCLAVRLTLLVGTVALSCAVHAPAAAQGLTFGTRPTGRYEPHPERLWEEYKRTGCITVNEQVRRRDGKVVNRKARRCGGAAWSTLRD
jgi:hypothetical protein